MKLFSYCIPMDDGAAPNPYWGVCTLTICKPQIRRVATKGDWIVGVGSKRVKGKSYAGRLVYAMKVTDVMSLEDYDVYCQEMLPGKIPDIESRSYKRKVGDCIYDFSRSKPMQRKGVHRPEHQAKDLRGLNALLSRHFYYFGESAVKIPAKFSALVRQGQGFQSTKNESIKDDFVTWLQGQYKRNRLYGKPQVKLRFLVNGGECGCVKTC